MKKKKLKKKTIRNIILSLIMLLLLVVVCIYTIFIRPNQNKETIIYMETQVQRGDMVQGIIENGTITLGEKNVSYEIEINYEEEDDDDDEEEDENRYLVIEEVYVVQGQRVSAGDPLFRFSEDSIIDVRRKLQNAKSEAQVELADANTEYDSQLQSAKSTYSSSKAAADTAARSYDVAMLRLQQEINVLFGDIQVLEAEIDDCNQKLTDEDTLERYSELKYALELAEKKINETGTESVSAYTSNYEEYVNAKRAFEQVDSTLEGYRDTISRNQEMILEKIQKAAELQTSMEQDQKEVKQTYDSSVLSGDLAGEIYDYTVRSLQESVDEAQQAVEEAQELLSEYDAFVGEDGIIYAPEDGLVTSVNYDAGDKLMTTGTMLSYSTADSYTISIDVSEEDIAYINVGDSVDIEVNAYSDEKYEGIVTAVTTSANSGYSTTVNFPVTISILGDTSKLYGGMTADITFVTDGVEDVLYVSARAVEEDENGNTFVYVKNASGEMETKNVVTGFSNGSEVEIREGLEEGETIWLASVVNSEQSEESLRGENTASEEEISGMGEGFPEGDFEMPDMEGGQSMPDGMGGGQMPGGMGGGQMPGGMGGGRP